MASQSDKFTLAGSPLNGRTVPRDWKLLDPGGKRARLVALGWAPDLYEAGRLLARHSAASRAAKSPAVLPPEDPRRWWDN